MSALTLAGVVKRWGPREVLRGVDLTLEPGTRAFLGGRNGAGKTTLLRIAAGLLEPEDGHCRLLGKDPLADRCEYQSKLGYLPAGNGGLYARLTVRQNLGFWGSMGLLGRRECAAAIDRLVGRFELDELTDNRVDRISMGQRQRVRLAATFIHSPEVILLDEPHTSLDEDAIALLQEALDDHHENGGASLWCAPASTQAAIESDVSWRVEDGIVVPA